MSLPPPSKNCKIGFDDLSFQYFHHSHSEMIFFDNWLFLFLPDMYNINLKNNIKKTTNYKLFFFLFNSKMYKSFRLKKLKKLCIEILP